MTDTETKTAEAATSQEGAAGENPLTPPANNPSEPETKAPESTGKRATAPKAKPPVETAPPPPEPKVKKVRVICEGPLGPLLLAKGQETKDPRYVAILDTPGQAKVEAVK